ncbi:MAG: hypothetical protein ABIP17_13405 [Ilumatobacteraceae bacterium]
MKRVTWFVTGIAAGAAGTNYASRKVKQTAAQLAPANVARGAARTVRHSARRLADAASEGRSAMRDREDELKARRDARLQSIDDQLEPGDQLLVDGRPVDSGRVIVLKHKR